MMRRAIAATLVSFLSCSNCQYAWAQTSQGIFINAGGPTFVDSLGQVWQTDANFASGESYNDDSPIAGTSDEVLYQSQKVGYSQSRPLKYEIPVSENGMYEVSLHFAEIQPEAMAVGARVFDVLLEGVTAIENLDVYSEVGHHTALTKIEGVEVNDGSLSIEFFHEAAMISAIKVLPVSATARRLQQASLPLYINAGGNKFVDSKGRTWNKDSYFNGGGQVEPRSIPPPNILNTVDDVLYQTARFDPPKDPKLEYSIPLPNGQYEVVLHFSENYPAAQKVGARRFKVFMEGFVAFSDIDIFKEAGKFKPLIKKKTVTVSDGTLNIGFEKIEQNAKICAIEVHEKSIPSPPSTASANEKAIYRINAGSNSYVDTSGNTWSGDSFYNNGGQVETWSSGSRDILKTTDDALYRTGRFDPPSDPQLKYDLPVSNGKYRVVMHFSETYDRITSPGMRIFDVFIEEEKVLNRLDIFAEGGGAFTAVKKSTVVQVNDGKLTISFGERIRQNAKICAIEVYSVGSSDVPSVPNGGSSSLATTPVYVNVGGDEITEPSGIVWEKDKYFSNGLIEKLHGGLRNIFGTTNDMLYQTARYDPSTDEPSLKYKVPIANGDYTVTLHWADTYLPTQKIGARVFDVIIQGLPVRKNLDIFREAGANAVLKLGFPAKVTNNMLEVSFAKVKENPKLCALEIHAGNPPSTNSSPDGIFPLYINAGGQALTDSTGISWKEDSYYNNGGTVEKSFGSPNIAGAADSSIYLTSRYDPKPRPSLQYNIPCPNGVYSVRLHFAELYAEVFKNGGRVFSVRVEDVVVKDIDIYAESGGSFSALVKSVSTTVNDGFLSIFFIHGSAENPKISAIEVHKEKSTAVSSPGGGPSPVPAPAGKSVFINAGSKRPFTDSKGNVWVADKYFNTGMEEPLAVGSISGTSDAALFRTGRYDPKSGDPLKYVIPVSNNGNYDVSLFFAETYSAAMQPGFRVFDISVNGLKKFSDFDIYKEAKSGNTVVKKTTTVNVEDKQVVILFDRIAENPKVNAIQVTPSPSSSQPSNPSPVSTNPILPIRINAGGEAYYDSSGNLWVADAFSNNGGEDEKLWNPVSTIYGTPDDELYMTAKYDASPSQPVLTYDIPVPNGDLAVTLHFCELYSKAMFKGARVFDVIVEGKKVLSNFDIYAEAGGFTALKETMDVVVNDGKLSISFNHIKENPKISAIEIKEKEETTTVSSALAPPPIQSSYLVNVGGDTYKDSSGRTWQADKFFNDGGEVESIPNVIPAISKTLDDELYRTGRYDPDSGPGLKYEFPIPDGDYAVTLHFSENWKGAFKENARVFDIILEGAEVISDLDIYKEAGKFAALTKTAYASVNDGFLTLEFGHKTENPKLSAVEIKAATIPSGKNSHRAHAVPGGPYIATDVDGNDIETIKVDGSFSHTHTAGSDVVSFVWKVDGKTVGNGMITEITLPVGVHKLILEVVDSDGDFSSDYTTANIKPKGFPDITSLSPPGGDVTGGGKVLIKGSGFASPAAQTKVHFGSTTLTGSQIIVVNESLIEVKKAPAGFMGPAIVTVDTEVGPSNKAYYAYSDKSLPPVDFKFGVTANGIFGPTTLAFGPDGKLYIGTQAGSIIKASLDANYQIIESTQVVSDVIADSSPGFRSILGITFNPMDVSPNPTVYVAHCSLFHGQVVDYNGKVSAVSGAKLDRMEHIVTGLPVSDHDHGVNGMEFDDNGDLFIQVGGNTNAGVPGALSSTLLQDEGVLSAATVVAHVSRPNFNGNVEYNNKGDITSGSDVEVWASGQRNAFDLVLHSNGYMYGTDNGPNNKYGMKSESCDSQTIDPHEDDKLNLLEKGKYYGHANRKRGEKDPRQCKWRSATEKSDSEYTAPMHMLPASCNGIAEFQTRHFGDQLRGHLLIGRYKGALYHVALSNDGRSVVGQHQVLEKAGGLDVTQGPDGTLFVAQNAKGQVIFHTPNEPALGKLHIVSVFPRRGPKAGGSTLTLYGEQFGSSPSVTVGGKNCPVESNNGKMLTCKLPSGSGKADIIITSGGKKDTFTEAYRFISGNP